MDARSLFREGRLREAIESLGAELRRDPTDAQRRTFLFELLCFAGEYDRAERQLDILADQSSDAAAGALLYRSALHAERLRQRMFLEEDYPRGEAPSVGGSLNGEGFERIEDADPRIGARLELFAAGQYTWIPFAQLSSVEMEEPKRLRDLIWAPAALRTAPDFHGLDLGEVLLPALTPLAWRDPDEAVNLGRVTEWVRAEDGAVVPLGQKLLLVDGEEFPLLEVRKLEFAASSGDRD